MEIKHGDFAGVILAGGKSSRMGSPKPFLKLHGKRMIDIALDSFRGVFDEIIIAVDDRNRFVGFQDVNIVDDLVKDCGPLGGIHAGLEAISHKNAFFMACDMPYLHIDVIRQLLMQFQKTQCDALVPQIGGAIEPLCAVYRKELKDDLYAFIKKSCNNSAKSFLDTINTCYWIMDDTPFNSHVFRNLNTPNDLCSLSKEME
ncbi:molybdenum cofactor guanylyltransferase [Candidatus Omnitrophota bacterium]